MKTTNLQKSFDNFSLHIDELSLAQNKVYGLIGANGCGKTTLVKLMAGLIPPDGGSIDSEGLTSQDITMLPRKPYLLHDSVYENLIYPLKLRKIKPEREKTEYYLELAGLADKQKQYAPQLSGGEQQKLALIRALIFSPKLILLDEGMSNLDIESCYKFEELILQRQKTAPATWLIVSHQLSHIERLCEYVFFMDNGKIASRGDTEEILSRPQDAALIRYLQSESLRWRDGIQEKYNGTFEG